jgi:hypothetical protein
MRDRPLIYAGLILFVALVTYPVWNGVAAHTSAKAPELRKPEGKTCVAPREYMRAAHMELLIKMREGAVREHQLNYRAYDGKTYKVSLTKTCLGECHGQKEQFCDRCHKFTAVSGPFCWDCHNDIPATPSATMTAFNAAGSVR